MRIQAIERNTMATKDDVRATKGNVEVTKANVETLLSDVDTAAILQPPTVAFVASSVHNTCLKGTREAVLQTTWHWADDDSSDKPIFWLCDIAGSGKSTVAMSAVESWRKKGVLGGRFFFSIASNEKSTTDKFCSTIARDLVQYIPELAPHIAEAVKQNPSFMRSALDEQFQVLVGNPVQHRQGRVILVIGALDECKLGSQRRELVGMLSATVREYKNLRIFITSRPDPVIQAALGPLSIKAKLEDRLHNFNYGDNIKDIAVYVHQSLDGVLPVDKRQRLADKANGLFIWAATACRMLKDETSLSSPKFTYDLLIFIDQAGAIDKLYSLIFERIDPMHYEVMYSMLALLLAAFEPLTTADLDDILEHAGIHGSAKTLVRSLGSVLIEDASTNLIQFRHPTLVEYLRRCSVNPTVSSSNKMYINGTNAHEQAASWCLECFKSPTEGLRFNIYQIESSLSLNRQISDLDARVSRFISRKLRYASSHWLFHLVETGDEWRGALERRLEHALRIPYVLYWMEILSLTGGVPRAITDLRAATRCTGIEEIKSRMTDIRRFLTSFLVPIQDSAPHIYISALPFSQINSVFHVESLKRHANTLTVTQGLEEMYPGLPRSLKGHEGSILSINFSPDGSRIISGSEGNTIRLWMQTLELRVQHVPTSENVADIFTKPLGRIKFEYLRVYSVQHSPDGSRIVSSPGDSTIRLWNATTRQPLGKPLQGHEDRVRAAGFSPDGSRIVSGSDDITIRVWDAETGQPLGDPLRGHKGWVRAVQFSPDGSRIVSGSDDQTVRLWNAATGQPLGEPDDSWIVSGSADDLPPLSAKIDDTEESDSSARTDSRGTPPRILVPGFSHCSLSQDGWVQSSGQFLFWVPPDNRHGLQYPSALLTLPTNSPLRLTKVDFTHFQCGTSWINVLPNANR
ncbi:related to WD40-repeat protein (notchless protein) [Serendipita indica DSM 11827]|uniref:Related to WD40-repeat protein (Notchless protein) n=1 Tax=Serendipita indica (strain DSM 11827) TaxID=1109443 RepID=G4TMZ9_SERID|nr:related to WD40-repeat protein (notchless protein) [Serendipita indica DSM 11827]